MSRGFVDIHHHLLYDIDDGPRKPEEMQKMLEMAAADGIGEIVVTPHVVPGVEEFDYAQYRKALYQANEYSKKKKLKIQVYGGVEILYTDHACRMLSDGEIPTMAGTNCVLVEFSPDIRFEAMKEALERLYSHGYRPIIAHAERYRCLRIWPKRVVELKENMEIYIQINCSTLVLGGRWIEKLFVHGLMRHRLVDAIATDAHNTTSRYVRLKAAWQAVKEKYGEGYADRLTSGWMLEE